MKKSMKVLLFAAMLAATFAKPLCSDNYNCGSKDETEKRILLLQGTLNNETANALIKLLNSLPISGDGKTLLLSSARGVPVSTKAFKTSYDVNIALDIILSNAQREFAVNAIDKVFNELQDDIELIDNS
jgi:hypothetical protein